MAAKLFSIIGDSNVRRNMTGLNVASREVMKSAEVIDYVLGTPFDQALAGVRAESSVLIVAALTDLIMTNGDCGTVSASIDPVLDSIFTSIAAFCNSRPTTQVRSFLRVAKLFELFSIIHFVCKCPLVCKGFENSGWVPAH